MDYRVHSPIEELKPFIKCLWTLEAPATNQQQRQRIIPDGCMEMIFHYGDPYRQYFSDGSFLVQPKSFVFGQISDVLEIEPTGASAIVAARFLPEGLAPFLNKPVSSLENKAVALEELFGEQGSLLEQNVLKATGNEERMKFIQDFILSRLTHPLTIDAVARACVETIFQSQGSLKMEQVADKVQLSRRKMERKFVSAVGISPKQLSKLARLQAALKILSHDKTASLTSVAYESGYYDQAHFIRDFRDFTGMSPKSFFSDNLRLSALFMDNLQ